MELYNSLKRKIKQLSSLDRQRLGIIKRIIMFIKNMMQFESTHLTYSGNRCLNNDLIAHLYHNV